jgi:hypothetical protein
LVLAFHQGFLCFQIFPRAGHNVWVVLAATAPLATLLAYRTYRAVVTHESSRAQRRAAIALCAALPLWLAAPVATDTLRRLVTQEPVRAAGLPHTRGIELDTEDFRIQHVDAVRQLVRHLRSTRASDSRMLLIGTEHMIHYASDLPSLAPESEFLLYLAGSGMIGQSQAHRLGDEEIARRLETTPNARVVISDDSSARRLIALLPETQRVIAGRFRIEARFGPYTVWRPPEDQGRAIAR